MANVVDAKISIVCRNIAINGRVQPHFIPCDKIIKFVFRLVYLLESSSLTFG